MSSHLLLTIKTNNRIRCNGSAQTGHTHTKLKINNLAALQLPLAAAATATKSRWNPTSAGGSHNKFRRHTALSNISEIGQRTRPGSDARRPRRPHSENMGGRALLFGGFLSGQNHYELGVNPDRDSPTAGLSDYRNSAPSPRKRDSRQQPINCHQHLPWAY